MSGRTPVRVKCHLRFALASQRDMRINVVPLQRRQIRLVAVARAGERPRELDSEGLADLVEQGEKLGLVAGVSPAIGGDDKLVRPVDDHLRVVADPRERRVRSWAGTRHQRPGVLSRCPRPGRRGWAYPASAAPIRHQSPLPDIGRGTRHQVDGGAVPKRLGRPKISGARSKAKICWQPGIPHPDAQRPLCRHLRGLPLRLWSGNHDATRGRSRPVDS